MNGDIFHIFDPLPVASFLPFSNNPKFDDFAQKTMHSRRRRNDQCLLETLRESVARNCRDVGRHSFRIHLQHGPFQRMSRSLLKRFLKFCFFKNFSNFFFLNFLIESQIWNLLKIRQKKFSLVFLVKLKNKFKKCFPFLRTVVSTSSPCLSRFIFSSVLRVNRVLISSKKIVFHVCRAKL